MHIADHVRRQIFEAVLLSGVELQMSQIQLDHPTQDVHGDYSTNIAMVLKGGRTLAEEIAQKIHSDEIIQKVEVAGGGFLNVWLQTTCLVSETGRVLTEAEDYGRGNLYINKKVMVEFTDPNPFKEFHIGHVYSNIVGQTISTLIEFQGAEVWRVCYQGDVGLHVAKSVWGMNELSREAPLPGSGLPDSPSDKAKFLGKCYALGAASFENDEIAKKEIIEINARIYSNPDFHVYYKIGRDWSLQYFDSIYQKLGTKFNKLYFESDAAKVGIKIVEEGLAKGIFESSDGAVVYKGEKHGLHTRVFINSQGLPTYEAKELGLAPTKYADFPYDLSIIITANEINEYFKVLLAALGETYPELAAKTKHISHGMVRLPSGKMSSRTGKVITGEWLIEQARELATQKIAEVIKHRPTGEHTTGLADLVGVGAIKYAFLKSSIGGDVEFDFDESISFDGNSGPYLQYTYARTQSILEKIENISLDTAMFKDYRFNLDEQKVLKMVYQFGEAVEQAASRLHPHLLCNYLFELAQRYNAFYSSSSVLSAEIPQQRDFRILLTAAIGQVLKNGLKLLGIEALARM